MENSKGKVIYCEKCGFSKWRDNDTLREEGIGECPHCKIPMKILERDDLVTYEDYQLINNRAFIESQGYTWFDEGWNGWIDYCDDLNKKVVDEYISKLPTFDKYAMYAKSRGVGAFFNQSKLITCCIERNLQPSFSSSVLYSMFKL